MRRVNAAHQPPPPSYLPSLYQNNGGGRAGGGGGCPPPSPSGRRTHGVVSPHVIFPSRVPSSTAKQKPKKTRYDLTLSPSRDLVIFPLLPRRMPSWSQRSRVP
ncbi:hypothetical protein NL676_022800 [Syzygium grande]|nr:hypothetical protein NL676_022800 [Syzygium grande]